MDASGVSQELKSVKSIFDWKDYPNEFKQKWHAYIDKEFTKQHITNNFKYGIIRLNDQYYHKYIEYELLLLDYKNKINLEYFIISNN